MARDEGTEEMQDIARAIKDGADGYIKAQYTTIFKISGVVGLTLFLVGALIAFMLGLRDIP